MVVTHLEAGVDRSQVDVGGDGRPGRVVGGHDLRGEFGELPRTLLIRCRTENPTAEWKWSTVHVPAIHSGTAAGSTVASLMKVLPVR